MQRYLLHRQRHVAEVKERSNPKWKKIAILSIISCHSISQRCFDIYMYVVQEKKHVFSIHCNPSLVINASNLHLLSCQSNTNVQCLLFACHFLPTNGCPVSAEKDKSLVKQAICAIKKCHSIISYLELASTGLPSLNHSTFMVWSPIGSSLASKWANPPSFTSAWSYIVCNHVNVMSCI